MKQVVVAPGLIQSLRGRSPLGRLPATRVSRVALLVAVVALVTDWVTPPGYRSGLLVLCCAGLLVALRSRRLALLTVLASSWIVLPAIGTGMFIESAMRERPRVIAIDGILGPSIPGLASEEMELCGASRFDVETWADGALGGLADDLVWNVAALHNALVMDRVQNGSPFGCAATLEM